MLIEEIKPCCVAVRVALSGVLPPERLSRLIRCRELFPDIGTPYVTEFGFLRFSGELSFLKPEATEEELSLLPGLTTYL